MTKHRQAAEHEPIARVLPMLSVPHLDRDFDYLVSAEQSDDAQPGVRVRVRFHGRLVDAFVLERRSETDHVGKLGWLDRVVSAEPVLTPDVRRLVDAVAARYAGTRADVLRLAIPPRHANVEKRNAPPSPTRSMPSPRRHRGVGRIRQRRQFLAALPDGRAARAVWQALPGEQWADRLAEVAAVDGRGRARGAGRSCPTSATSTRCPTPRPARRRKPGGRAVGGARAPHSATGAGCRCCAADARLVIGTRSAVFAPVADLGLVLVWDDGDDTLVRAARAVSARPRGGDAACPPIALCRNDRRLRAHRRGAGAGAQRLGARPGGGPAGRAVPGTAGDRARGQRLRPGARPGRAHARGCRRWRCGPRGRRSTPARPVLVQVPRQGLRARAGLRPLPHHRPLQALHRPAVAARPGRRRRGVPMVRPRGAALRCARCGSDAVRAVVVGARRTAEELGRAFPGTTVVTSGGDAVVSTVPGDPAVVVATPGAEPVAAGGYGAALLLDAGRCSAARICAPPRTRCAAGWPRRRWSAAAPTAAWSPWSPNRRSRPCRR